MAPQLFTRLTARDDSSSSDSTSNPTIIAGIIVAAVIGLGAAIWLVFRWYRKRAAQKREERRGSAFDHFQADDGMSEKSGPQSAGADLSRKKTTGFSRHQINSQVIMPERAILRPDASRDEILEHYTAAGKLPRPFAPFAPQPRLSVDTDLAPPTPIADRSPSGRPTSTASWFAPVVPFAGGHDSRRSSAISVSSSIGSAGGGAQKKVRQVFDPVLPDELVVSLGESLTVVQQHDDGWCIVGRDSVFNPGEVELGAVPAWAFLKPVKGLRAERPMRVSSLGVTVNLDAPPSLDPRDNVMSWSNF